MIERWLTWRPPAAARRCVDDYDRQDLIASSNGLVESQPSTHRGPAKPGPPGQRRHSFNLDPFMLFMSFMPFMFAFQL
jgi:hypothetical protein